MLYKVNILYKNMVLIIGFILFQTYFSDVFCKCAFSLYLFRKDFSCVLPVVHIPELLPVRKEQESYRYLFPGRGYLHISPKYITFIIY